MKGNKDNRGEWKKMGKIASKNESNEEKGVNEENRKWDRQQLRKTVRGTSSLKLDKCENDSKWEKQQLRMKECDNESN